jgi:trimeric autotransporter adhesin
MVPVVTGKVSWQVTGIRHDAYVDAHRIQVKVEKPPQEHGHYLRPELFGATPEQVVGHQMPPAPILSRSGNVSSLPALR